MKVSHLINPAYLYNNRWRISIRAEKAVAKILDTDFGPAISSAIESIPIFDNQRRLAQLKDRHLGQRCFIIGNGPSLRMQDLDRLKKEITFASNRIYLAFDQTEWRPTYYTVIDVLVAEQYAQIISTLPLKKIFSSDIRFAMPFVKGVTWVHTIENLIKENNVNPLFSNNLRIGAYGGWTVIYLQLQIAFYMGIREVYLLGVDFNYEIPSPSGEMSIHGPVVKQQDQQNHFHPDYREPGERWTMPRPDIQYRAFLSAKKAFELQGGKIYNASRTTLLDVYSLVDFDEILPS
jgi:uncharacterized Rossmann fold enzyme